ncbi:hypothetical protein HD554DRAFT_2020913 [Boletus coccyginus]|nr:hypothetical protein HD554DRAFT_2020913 [Boletus coccyginus]
MADCLAEDFEFKNVSTNATKEQTTAVQRASGTIGQVLVKSLGTKTPENIPMLLQIAFQAYLASALGQTASSWVFEPGHNAFINSIYQSLRGVEAQVVSGRWRSLARVHIVHNWVSHPESLVKGIIAGFSDILLAAGCTAPQSDITSKVTSKFEQKIALLVELAGRLNKLFDEVISSDFEILVVRPGEKFESKNMEDTDSDQAGLQDASVLCATHLGLIKRVPVGTLWEKGRKQKMTALKAKVLLESFLDTEDE